MKYIAWFLFILPVLAMAALLIGCGSVTVTGFNYDEHYHHRVAGFVNSITPGAVVVTGDSRIEGAGQLAPGYVNRGIASSRVANITQLARELLVLERAPVYHIHAGINDLCGGGTVEALAVDMAALRAVFARWVPGAVVVVHPLVPVVDGFTGCKVSSGTLNQRVAAANVALGLGLPPAGLTTATGALTPTHTIDGIHYNNNGNRAALGVAYAR